MPIKFKALRYGHRRQAQLMTKDGKTLPEWEDEVNLFYLSLVDSWDFTDGDTGEPLILNGNPQETLMKLTLEQVNKLESDFVTQLEKDSSNVPKTSAGPSPSGSMVSKPAKGRRASRRNGPSTS